MAERGAAGGGKAGETAVVVPGAPAAAGSSPAAPAGLDLPAACAGKSQQWWIITGLAITVVVLVVGLRPFNWYGLIVLALVAIIVVLLLRINKKI
jgi:hypothetical protein